MVHICEIMISPGVFLFSWNFHFSGCYSGKRAKIAQNEEKKQLHLSHAISQEQYSKLSWFLVHLFKMMISPGIFFNFFEIFIFWAIMGVKGQKIAQNEK